MPTLLSKTQAGGVVGDLYIDGSGFHIIDQVYASGVYRWRILASGNPDGDGPEIWNGGVAYEQGDVVATPTGALWRALVANGPNAAGLHPSVISNWQFIGMLEAQLYDAGQCYFTGMEAIIRPVTLGQPVNTFPDYHVRANVAQTTVAAWSLARAANWTLMKQTSVGLWVANYVFMAGIVVSHGGALYRALSTHQSATGVTPDTIPATWQQLTASAAAALQTFISLTDTPAVYSTPGFVPAINPGGNGLVFVDPSTLGRTLMFANEAAATTYYTQGAVMIPIGTQIYDQSTGTFKIWDGTSWEELALGANTFLALTDTPAAFGTPGQSVVVNPAGDGLVFSTASGSLPAGTKIGSNLFWDGSAWVESNPSAIVVYSASTDAQFETNTAAFPAITGSIYYNTTNDKLRIKDAGVWSDVGGGGGNLFDTNLLELNANRVHTIGVSNTAEFAFRVNNGSKFSLFGSTMGFSAETGSISMSNNNGHGITVTTIGAFLTTNAGFRVNNQPGTTGQVLTSQGPSAAPIWAATTGTVPAGTKTGSNLFWNGSAWVEARPAAIQITSFTDDAAAETRQTLFGGTTSGSVYFNSTTNKLRVWDDGVWSDVGGGGGATINNGTFTGQMLEWNGATGLWSLIPSTRSRPLHTTTSDANFQTFVNSFAATLQEGAIYYNSATDKIRVYDGAAWSDVGGGGGSVPNGTASKTMLEWAGSSWVASEPHQFDPIYRANDDASVQAIIANSGPLLEGQIYYNNTTDKVRVYNGTAWVDVGGGGDNLFTANLTMNGVRNHGVTGTFTMIGGASTTIHFQTQNGSGQNNRMQVSQTGASISSGEGGGSVHSFRAANAGLEINTNAPMRVNNQTGTTGQVLTSQGAGSAPIWAAAGGGSLFQQNQALAFNVSHSLNPTTVFKMFGAAGSSIDLGVIESTGSRLLLQDDRLTLSANTNNQITIGSGGIGFNGNRPLSLNSQPGTTGQVLTSQGPGAAAIWSTPKDKLMNVLSSDLAAQSADLQVTGGFYYNTTLNQMRLYNGTAWVSI